MFISETVNLFVNQYDSEDGYSAYFELISSVVPQTNLFNSYSTKILFSYHTQSTGEDVIKAKCTAMILN